MIASSTDDAARQASRIVITHGAMATTATTHSGTHPSDPVAAPSESPVSPTPENRSATSEAIPTSPITTGTHIHWATLTV